MTQIVCYITYEVDDNDKFGRIIVAAVSAENLGPVPLPLPSPGILRPGAEPKLKRLAVTGALGSVGSAVIQEALEDGHQVIGIDVRPHEVEGRYEFVQADLMDYSEVCAVLQDCDAV